MVTEHRHQIGDMTYTEFTGLPPEAGEDAVFRVYADSQVYAIVEFEFEDSTTVGLCYREHRDSPLITRVRLLYGDRKTVYDLEVDSVEQAVLAFQRMLDLASVADGHVLTPNLNRGRYAAHCRMMHCEPLGSTTEESNDAHG
jgi:hypothetical protein